MFLKVLSDQLLRPSCVLVIARAIKLIEIVYRIFEYSFIKNIICSLTFRIFVLALLMMHSLATALCSFFNFIPCK